MINCTGAAVGTHWRGLPLPLGLGAKEKEMKVLSFKQTNRQQQALLLQLPDRRINMGIDRFPIGMKLFLWRKRARGDQATDQNKRRLTDGSWWRAKGKAKGKSEWKPSIKREKREVHMCTAQQSHTHTQLKLTGRRWHHRQSCECKRQRKAEKCASTLSSPPPAMQQVYWWSELCQCSQLSYAG